MKKHYDFSKAERGKFYTPLEKLVFPPYANPKVIERERIGAGEASEKKVRNFSKARKKKEE